MSCAQDKTGTTTKLTFMLSTGRAMSELSRSDIVFWTWRRGLAMALPAGHGESKNLAVQGVPAA
jgi:hypothetical protein